jgi:hypothetical protein
MSEIGINLDREESYAFLAATEFVRQLFSDEEGGIPLTSSIQFPLTSRRYARANVVFKLGDSSYTAKVFVTVGTVWPREGYVGLTNIDTVIVDIIYSLKLSGNPGQPVVEFDHLKVVPQSS